MNIEKLEIDIKVKQQALKVLEAEVIDRESQATIAKAKARGAKFEYRKARKESKEAKKLFRVAEEQADRQRRMLAKAEKLFGKALGKAAAKQGTAKPVRAVQARVRRPVQKQRKVQPATAGNLHAKRPQPASPQRAGAPLAA